MRAPSITHDTSRIGLALLIVGFLPAAALAQSCPYREYAWTRTIGSEQGDYLIGGVAVDIHDNVLIAGQFGGKIDLDPGSDKDNRRPRGMQDAFVSWYRPEGSYGGAYTFGVTGEPEYPYSVALSVDKRPDGGFIVGGLFNGKIDLDPTEGKDVRRPKGGDDAFLVAFRDDYAFDWAWTAGGQSYSGIWTVAVDPTGAIVIAGYFEGNMRLGEGENRRLLISNGNSDVFVAKLSPAGETLWFRAFGGEARDFAEAVAFDPSGAVVICGTFRGLVDFDPDGQHAVRTSNGGDDLFVLKLSSDGLFQWLKVVGGPETDRAISVAPAPSGDFYVGGAFGHTVDFDPEGSGDVHDSGAADRHAFVSRYSFDGGYDWTISFGGDAYTYVRDLIVNEDRLVLTGGYLGTVDLDPGEGVDERPPFGERSNYVCYWSLDGDYMLGDVFGGDGFDRTIGIAADSSGDVYVGGDFDSPLVDYDPTAGVCEAVSHGGTDVFLSKFYCGQCEYVERHDLEYDGSGLRSTTYTLAANGRLTAVLSSDNGEWRKTKQIDANGFVQLKFKDVPPGSYQCSIRNVRDDGGSLLCEGEIAQRFITIP